MTPPKKTKSKKPKKLSFPKDTNRTCPRARLCCSVSRHIIHWQVIEQIEPGLRSAIRESLMKCKVSMRDRSPIHDRSPMSKTFQTLRQHVKEELLFKDPLSGTACTRPLSSLLLLKEAMLWYYQSQSSYCS